MNNKSGEWKIFTGNEIGILLAWWVWDQFRTHHPDTDPAKCVMLNTTVSSKMLSAMAKKEGFKYDVSYSLSFCSPPPPPSNMFSQKGSDFISIFPHIFNLGNLDGLQMVGECWPELYGAGLHLLIRL